MFTNNQTENFTGGKLARMQAEDSWLELALEIARLCKTIVHRATLQLSCERQQTEVLEQMCPVLHLKLFYDTFKMYQNLCSELLEAKTNIACRDPSV